ncbi:type 1 glutamine amidotransferase [Ferrovibrio terrae]|uniref:type 1 glutamine amidotransferase n=1 Tax=Ferrovibrio terrae TaxID=2594003 RepID=UPI003137D51F
MKIGIIECGPVPAPLRERYVSYPAMFRTQLQPLLPTATFETIAVAALGDVAAFDAYLLTGSRHGVYDDLPWIAPLKDFIRAAARLQRPMVGVCFGHQIIAEALGGRVEKAAAGWRVGLEQYTTSLNGDTQSVMMPAFHQDQIVVQPPDTEVVANTAACPFAALRYTAAPILSVQFHPEFSLPYLTDLITCLSQQAAAPGLPPQPALDDKGMRWIGDFLSGR